MFTFRPSLRSFSIFMLVFAIGLSFFLSLHNSRGKSWTSGISSGSVVDNPGFAIFVEEIEELLAMEGFVSCEGPSSFNGLGTFEGKWFRSTRQNGLYVFTYVAPRYYTADVCVSDRGSIQNVPALKGKTEELVAKMKELWNHERHELHNWSESNPR